jgi:organic radical activating enzyme
MSEDPQADAAPDPPVSPGTGRDVTPAGGRPLSGLVASRLADQARRTTQAARARRVATTGGEPGVLDLTPLRELVSELTEELQKARPRERIARALRQAADIIDPPKPIR